jgi:creatinine amidohydrolase
MNQVLVLPRTLLLAKMTTAEVQSALSSRAVVLLPVGSVEPHGPHLPLGTDTEISLEASRRAAHALWGDGVPAYLAPAIPYGVTDFAEGFAGAVSVGKEALEAFLRSTVEALLRAGFAHVCVVNNHLEPAHDAAIRAAVTDIERASVACPLSRRWARTLTEEFKKGECHAGQYETSLMLAVDDVPGDHHALARVPVSLSEGIRDGKHTFAAMGMHAAYAGSPKDASREEGVTSYEKLATMIVTEVTEGLARTAA